MENKKFNVWLYAVILFISAFIVLLFAGYSQIRLNKNLNDYKSQVFSTETEKNEYLQNFASAQEMNEELNKEIGRLEEQNGDLINEISALSDEKKDIEKTIQLNQEAFSSLTRAFDAYTQGEVIQALEQLKTVKKEDLDKEAAEACKALELELKAEAGKMLFDEGFSFYDRAKYTHAVEKLFLSLQYAPQEEFSDKCLYYLGYAEFRTGEKATAVEHMERLIREFPESNYFRRAEKFVGRYAP